MGNIAGKVIDKKTGEAIAARVQIISSSGRFSCPPESILKIGSGAPFFYADGEFETNVGRGKTKVLVERGTEYIPEEITIDVPANGTATISIELERWSELPKQGWHPGNTHIHYDEKEKHPDRRLKLDPRVEDLRMTAISILKRWDLEYATNKYPIGMLTDVSTSHHYVQCGEETRHDESLRNPGYGHVMLLNIRNIVEPVSRGMLVDAFDPDYPPITYACNNAHDQGGVVIWCHNGRGMEAPVAAVLGKLDAFNLFDGIWNDLEYDIYYKMLNTGIRLPASTGSDWFISSSNRVYAYTGDQFRYEPWLEALKTGRTFITNGPALHLSVEDKIPGDVVEVDSGQKLHSSVHWSSHYSIHKVEIIFNGSVVSEKDYIEGSKSGTFETEFDALTDGWIAARLWSDTRNSFNHPIFAHTSPVYIKTGIVSLEHKQSAMYFDRAIENSLEWIKKKGRFYKDQQRREVSDLFRTAQAAYKGMLE